MLKLEGVSKRYKGANVNAVDNLTLEVRPGEIFGFLGPNGAGKTTTIKMVVGLLTADRGKIVVNGQDLAADPLGAKRSIGFVPDNPNLYPRLTGLEYLNLIGDVYGVDGATRKRRLDHYLGMFELTGALGDLIQSYSRGMQQKLALTGALCQPPLFILDEPMVGLDPRSAHLFKNIIATIEAGQYCVFSTHVLEVAEQLCDRVGSSIRDSSSPVAPDELRQTSGQVGSNLENCS